MREVTLKPAPTKSRERLACALRGEMREDRGLIQDAETMAVIVFGVDEAGDKVYLGEVSFSAWHTDAAAALVSRIRFG